MDESPLDRAKNVLRNASGKAQVGALSEQVDEHTERLDRQRAQLDSQRERLDNQRARIDEQGQRLGTQREQLDSQRDRLDQQAQRLTTLEADYDRIRVQVREMTTAYNILQHQVAALEERFGALTAGLASADVTGDASDQAAARNILTEVQTEHARIRAHFTVITAYEERIRRLELVAASPPSATDESDASDDTSQ